MIRPSQLSLQPAGRRPLAQTPAHLRPSRGYHQDAFPSETPSLPTLRSREGLLSPGQSRRIPIASREIGAGLCHTTPKVRYPPPRFASREKWVPSRLPYAWRGEDRTIVPSAGGGYAHVRLSAFQPAAVAPGKPTCTQPGSGLHCSGSPHWREEQPSTLAGKGRAPFFPFRSPRPPSVAGPPAAAERPQPLTAWPAPRRPEPRGGASACGAGRARAGRLGESARAEPCGAERSREVLGSDRRSRTGCLRLSADPAASLGSEYLHLCSGSRKTLFSWAPPGVSEGIGALGRLCAPLLRRRPRGPASRRALEPRASSPGDRTPEQ